MSNFISAANPTAPITTEAEAQAAARSSAVSIIIGVIVGLISVAWSYTQVATIADAAVKAGGDASTAGAQAQMAIWIALALVVVQAIFAFVQWRNPMKWVAILFIVLIGFGIVTTALAPMIAGMMPNVPVTPMWQIVLTLAIYVIQIILHVAGMRGIDRLEALQMAAAR